QASIKMIKELLEWERRGLWRPGVPEALEQDPGFEPSANRSQGFGPGNLRSFDRLGLLFFPRLLAFRRPGQEAEWESTAALMRGREPGDTNKRKRRNTPVANAFGWPDRS